MLKAGKVDVVEMILLFQCALGIKSHIQFSICANECIDMIPFLPAGALGYFLCGYVPPGTPNWHPVLKKNSLKTDTPF